MLVAFNGKLQPSQSGGPRWLVSVPAWLEGVTAYGWHDPPS